MPKNYETEFTHIGFIDNNEFIHVVDTSKTVIDALANYKDYGGLNLN